MYQSITENIKNIYNKLENSTKNITPRCLLEVRAIEARNLMIADSNGSFFFIFKFKFKIQLNNIHIM